MGSLGGPSMGHMGNLITSACGQIEAQYLKSIGNKTPKPIDCYMATDFISGHVLKVMKL